MGISMVLILILFFGVLATIIIVGRKIRSSNIDSEKFDLITVTNVPPGTKQCIKNKTYDLTKDKEFYVKDECSSVFYY